MFNKKTFYCAALLMSLVMNVNQIFAAPAVYAQLASNADQLATPDTVNQPTAINLQVVDSISGMQWQSNERKLLIQQTGIYVISSDVQVGARESATNIIKGGDIYYWLELNGTPIPDTGNWVFASPESRSKGISMFWITPLKEGDVLRFMFSSSAASMGLITIPAKDNIPNSPGLSLMIYKVNDETSTTQATSK
jgi:hypothetical protein